MVSEAEENKAICIVDGLPDRLDVIVLLDLLGVEPDMRPRLGVRRLAVPVI